MSNQDKKALTKDRLIGMQVYNSEGNLMGEVQDIAFTVGKMGMTLIVETKKGESQEFAWEDIQAAGDIVVLKPKGNVASMASTTAATTATQPAQTQTPTCPTCGGPLTYIAQYQRWYCYKDKKYV